MAKIFKITGYFVDCNDDYDCDRLKIDLEQDYDLIAHHINVEERDIDEWDDDIPLNKIDCPVSECEKYFIKKGHWIREGWSERDWDGGHTNYDRFKCSNCGYYEDYKPTEFCSYCNSKNIE